MLQICGTAQFKRYTCVLVHTYSHTSKSSKVSVQLYLAHKCRVCTSAFKMMWHTRDVLHTHARHKHTVCLMH